MDLKTNETRADQGRDAVLAAGFQLIDQTSVRFLVIINAELRLDVSFATSHRFSGCTCEVQLLKGGRPVIMHGYFGKKYMYSTADLVTEIKRLQA
jgi:hypothetical protein